MIKGVLDNGDIAELLAREAEQAEGHRQMAFKRGCHEAFLWPEEAADVKLSDIEGLPPATVAVLEAGGYKTLNDIIDLEREDFLKLAGIAPEEADRLMAFINEVTAEGGADSDGASAEGATPAAESPAAAVDGK